MKPQDVYSSFFNLYSGAARRLPGGYAPPPLHLFLAPTMSCNLACGFCFGRSTASMTVARVAVALRQFPAARLVSVSGGEPFHHPEIRAMIDLLCKYRMVTVETNGTLIDEGTALFLAARAPRRLLGNGLYSVDFSVYGTEGIHDPLVGVPGSHRRLVAAASAVVARRRGRFPLVTLRTVILQDLAGRLGATWDLAREIGADLVVYKLEDGVRHGDAVSGTNPITSFHDVRYPDHAADGLAAEFAEIGRRAAARGGPPVMTVPLGLPPGEIARYCRGGAAPEGCFCDTPWTRAITDGRHLIACKVFAQTMDTGRSAASYWNSPPLRRFRMELRSRGLRPECRGCCFLRFRG